MTDLRLVVFDVDGTLIDSQAHIVSAMTKAFDTVGIKPPKRERILGIVGLSLPEAITQLAPMARDGQVPALVEAYKTAFRTMREAGQAEAGSPLYPNVRQVLDQLNQDPRTLLGLATGKSRRGLNSLIDAHDLRGIFVTQQCADDHPSKPNPAMLMAALAEAGTAARHAVMIGDTSYDMEMARAAGMVAIGVSWGYHARDQLGAAHMVIDDIRLLPGLLAQIWGQMA